MGWSPRAVPLYLLLTSTFLPTLSFPSQQEFEILKSFRKGVASLLYLLPAERGRCVGQGLLLLLSVSMEEGLPQCFLQVGYGSREGWLGERTGTDLGSKSFEEWREIFIVGWGSVCASIRSVMDPRQEATKRVSIFNKQGPERSVSRIPKRA